MCELESQKISYKINKPKDKSSLHLQSEFYDVLQYIFHDEYRSKRVKM